MENEGLLLHVCCAPCAAGVLPALLEKGIHPVLYWNNPNIHPAAEYIRRLDTLKEFAAERCVPLVVDGEYGLRAFVERVGTHVAHRCATCYAMRLAAAARHAAANGFSAFSTTLLISPHQDHDMIRTVGERCAEKHGIRFHYEDFRPRFQAGRDDVHAMGLYMQKYCGCVYSEEERLSERLEKRKGGFYPNVPLDPESNRARRAARRARRAEGPDEA